MIVYKDSILFKNIKMISFLGFELFQTEVKVKYSELKSKIEDFSFCANPWKLDVNFLCFDIRLKKGKRLQKSKENLTRLLFFKVHMFFSSVAFEVVFIACLFIKLCNRWFIFVLILMMLSLMHLYNVLRPNKWIGNRQEKYKKLPKLFLKTTT